MKWFFERRANQVDGMNTAFLAVWVYTFLNGRPVWPWWVALFTLVAMAAISVWGEAQLEEREVSE